MTRRERMLKAIRHEIPDMVPCCPGIGDMIAIKMKRRPFWEFYLDINGNNSITKKIDTCNENMYFLYNNNEKSFLAYMDAVNYFGVIAWAYQINPVIELSGISFKEKIIDSRSDRVVTRTTMSTPDGSLWAETVYPIDNPPTMVRKYIKDFEKEFNFSKYFYPSLDKIDFGPVIRSRDYIGDAGINCVGVQPASLTNLDFFVDGGLGKLGLIYYDYPELIFRYKEIHEVWVSEYVKKITEAKCCDEIMIGASGLMTWQSPDITRRLSLDSIRQITRICKENNLISHLHCCGFERKLVEMCALETDLDVIEPLEVPPQGDCNLKELKEEFGNKLVFKGNLHTSSIMLSSVDVVEKAAIKCIEDAAEGGGFILATGDQVGRDTPYENIFRMAEICEKYGRY